MMKFIILSVGVFLSCAASMSQEVKHAPTFQSCAADLNLWTSQIPGWPNPSVEQSRGGTKNLTVQEMRGRVLAVSECSISYPLLDRSKPNELSASISLTMVYDNEIQERLMNFLDRHNLIVKFTLEDEAGKR
jgi:hypothetical protein